ncbi:N6-adenine-specific methylase [Dissulfurispira thermophila]|uniref:N6-adenine-specific methylase n=2 Tax=root TaxID=1 RepID=A0A7G1H3Q1_9BACT|nr:16S rRNA (guanine(966)-N(2))-methyltransferase RsmD [Dissulfurispira thermophila]BCB96357.1 N6-adenine-specific methylase [Dissulfurispira thermophila]
MRISGGIAKGRKVGPRKVFVKKYEDDKLRPTSAKVRQAIFNILGDKIIGAKFLDLYAGTGVVGIEALSRGAEKTIFVDNNSLRVNVIKDLLEKFGFKDRAVVIKDDAKDFLRKITQNSRLKTQDFFDIIFADPPYASGELDIVLALLDEKGILRDNGIVIAEHSSKRSMPLAAGSLKLKKTYKYGDTSLTLYKKEVKV